MSYRLTALLAAIALAATAGCASAVEGAASAADQTTTSTSVSTTEAARTESAPSEGMPTEEPPAAEPSEQQPPTDNPAADIDAATHAWADAACLDMVTMLETLMAFPDIASDAKPEEYAVANIDYYDTLATVVGKLSADISGRQAPGIPSGDLVHSAYAEHMKALGAAASEGAVDIELMHRSGSPADLTETINRVQASVDDLASADFAAKFVDDVELSLMMESAMDTAPNCALLG